jgi:two-component system response regulator QseB
MRILLAEDDVRLAEPLVDFLARERHAVSWFSHGDQALEALLAGEYELALLDWMLPGLDGLAIVSELRRRGSPILVLMLTARDSVGDVVEGLRIGADDYLVKPFRMVELAARIRSLERRAVHPYTPSSLRWGPLVLDPATGKASCCDAELCLTGKEFQLLEWFLRHPGQLFTRGRLLDQLWPLEAEAGEETVKTHLNNLRRKLRQAGIIDPIETAHGQGYRLMPPPS